MPVVDITPPATGSNGPDQRDGSAEIYSGDADGSVEVRVTRVEPIPCGVIRGAVESSLSTYLKLMHKMGILHFDGDQVICTGWRKLFRKVSNFTKSYLESVLSTLRNSRYV